MNEPKPKKAQAPYDFLACPYGDIDWTTPGKMFKDARSQSAKLFDGMISAGYELINTAADNGVFRMTFKRVK